MKMGVWDWISFVLLVIGGLNWGLVGAFSFNAVDAIFGTSIVSMIIYILVGLAAIFAIVSAFVHKKK